MNAKKILADLTVDTDNSKICLICQICERYFLMNYKLLFLLFKIKPIIFPLLVLSRFYHFAVAVDVDMEIFIQFNDGFKMSLLLFNRLCVNREIFRNRDLHILLIIGFEVGKTLDNTFVLQNFIDKIIIFELFLFFEEIDRLVGGGR